MNSFLFLPLATWTNLGERCPFLFMSSWSRNFLSPERIPLPPSCPVNISGFTCCYPAHTRAKFPFLSPLTNSPVLPEILLVVHSISPYERPISSKRILFFFSACFLSPPPEDCNQLPYLSCPASPLFCTVFRSNRLKSTSLTCVSPL